MLDEEHTFSAVPKLTKPLGLILGSKELPAMSLIAAKDPPPPKSSSPRLESVELEVGLAMVSVPVDDFVGVS